jgi:hypothetical protein
MMLGHEENFKNAIYFHCGDLDLSPRPTLELVKK